MVSDDLGLQVDFMGTIHGVRTFESLQSRAVLVPFGGTTLLVAALVDIVKSKRAAGRPKDYAVIAVLEATLDEIAKATGEVVASRAPRRPRTRD